MADSMAEESTTMYGSVMTTWLIFNTSFHHKTSEPVVEDQLTFASAYLQNDVNHTLWLVVPPVLLVLGCYGNLMTIVVMRGMRASESTACLSVYFTALAVSDLILLCTTVVWFWPEFAFNTPVAYFHDLSCSSLYFVSYATSLTSAWFLVAMTFQRLTSVVLPHRVGVLCTVRRGEIIIGTIVSIAIVANVHFFFHFRVEYVDGYPSCVSNNKNVVNVFELLDLCLASLIPFFLLIMANSVLIYRALQSIQMARKMTVSDKHQTISRSAKVSSMMMTLILISILFLLLTMPTCIYNLYLEMIGYYEGEIDEEQLRERLALADTVCTLLWVSNSAINFYIYILSGRKFRQETKQYLCLCFKHQ